MTYALALTLLPDNTTDRREGLQPIESRSMGEIECVFLKRRLGDPERRRRGPVQEAGIRLLEDLRRSMIEITGDPDLPMVEFVQKQRLPDGGS